MPLWARGRLEWVVRAPAAYPSDAQLLSGEPCPAGRLHRAGAGAPSSSTGAAGRRGATDPPWETALSITPPWPCLCQGAWSPSTTTIATASCSSPCARSASSGSTAGLPWPARRPACSRCPWAPLPACRSGGTGRPFAGALTSGVAAARPRCRLRCRPGAGRVMSWQSPHSNLNPVVPGGAGEARGLGERLSKADPMRRCAKRLVLLAVGAGVAALILAGCGSSSTPTSPTTSSAPYCDDHARAGLAGTSFKRLHARDLQSLVPGLRFRSGLRPECRRLTVPLIMVWLKCPSASNRTETARESDGLRCHGSCHDSRPKKRSLWPNASRPTTWRPSAR